MENIVVKIDTLLARWAIDTHIKEILMGKKSHGNTTNEKIFQNCEIEFKDAFFRGIILARNNIPNIEYNDKRYERANNSLYYGPFWFPGEHAVYIGQMDAGRRNGKGLLISFSGLMLKYCYEGYFENDLSNGFGRIMFTNGDWYLGQMERGVMKGQGKYRNNTTKSTYEGEFANDLPEGQGKELWDDGAAYLGHVSKGKKHGKGVFTTSAGTFQGEFYNGLFQGKGVLKAKDDKIFEGEWKNNTLTSPAKIHYKGSKYEGEINNRLLPEGKGVIEDSKRKIEGRFVNGNLDGKATSKDLKTGSISIGIYEQGFLQSGNQAPSSAHLDNTSRIENSHLIKGGFSMQIDKPNPPKKRSFFCCCKK